MIDDSTYHLRMALMFAKEGRHDKAREYLSMGKHLDPNQDTDEQYQQFLKGVNGNETRDNNDCRW